MAVELTLLARVAYRGTEVSGPRVRGLLALLAAGPRTGSGTARLVDGLWPRQRPENPVKALQVVVSRARAQLGAELIASTPTGYRLALEDARVDASALVAAAAEVAGAARRGDHAAALAVADPALALWDGGTAPTDPDADPDDPVAALRAERVLTRRVVLRARSLALSRLGRAAEAVGPLVETLEQQPHDEELLLELLRSEAATAGPAAALARYDGYRRELRDELGSEPGPGLRELHLELLREQAPVVRRGVRHDPNRLLGRDDDVAAVSGLLHSARVVSVVGPGGLGKTRLAQTVARTTERRSVHLVPLAGLPAEDPDAPADVLAEVASALGVGDPRPAASGRRDRRTELLRGVVELLGAGPTLLVLDNCEHVVRGTAELVAALVAMTADLRILTTSRTPLGLSSESVHLLPQLDPATAVELFGQRARAARPDVELDPAAVAALCAQLDGLPLALELAAARVRVLAVPEIARRLRDRFGLLRGGPRDAPARHRTLHAVVDWSWRMLDDDGRAAMRMLAVFPDGFSADAAQHVLPDLDALWVLEHLVDQSLIKAVDTAAGMRFRMLETVREFAAGRRDAAGEADRAVAALLDWASAFGIAHHGSLFGTDPFPAIALIRAERDNLLGALRPALAAADPGPVVAVMAVVAGLWIVESQIQRLGVLVDETAEVLGRFRPGPDLLEPTRTALTLSVAYQYLVRGPRASRALVALRRLAPAAPDTLLRAAAVVLVKATEGLPALVEMCDSDRPLVVGMANSFAGYVWESVGERARALESTERLLAEAECARIPWLALSAHARLSELALQSEQGERARRHMAAALPLYERFGATSEVIGATWWLALACLQSGALDEAESYLARTGPAVEAGSVDIVTATYGDGVRAEIRLARGDVDAGLAGWRAAVDGLRKAAAAAGADEELGLDQWAAEAVAVTVVAHARHGRLDLVDDLVAGLPGRLTAVLAVPAADSAPYLEQLGTTGALVLALAMVELDRAARTGDAGAAASGARLVAFAERYGCLRTFQPTMSSARAEAAAERADGPAYTEAVSVYAGLDRDGLAAAGRELLAAHRVSAPGPS